MPKRILVAPLDWGLGHATRCIPIIRALLAKGHVPVLATDGGAYDLLAAEFPQLQLLRLKGYQPVYPENGNMVWAIGKQLPHFLNVISHERKIADEWVKKHQLDGIISDNRYGLYTNLKPTVFITHQLNIRMPEWAAFMNAPVARLNNYFLSKFNSVWIPDWPHERSLTGELSKVNKKQTHYHYIGPLSRLGKFPVVPLKYDLLVLLSGPEPQRTLLEQKILSQLPVSHKRVLLVQGLTSKKETHTVNDKLDIATYLNSEELLLALAQSKMVIARAGYSTIMDLVATGKQALLIPTPGQTEQEYLAKTLTAKKWFYSISQDELNLSRDIEIAEKYFPPESTLYAGNLLGKELDEWLLMM